MENYINNTMNNHNNQNNHNNNGPTSPVPTSPVPTTNTLVCPNAPIAKRTMSSHDSLPIPLTFDNEIVKPTSPVPTTDTSVCSNEPIAKRTRSSHDSLLNPKRTRSSHDSLLNPLTCDNENIAPPYLINFGFVELPSPVPTINMLVCPNAPIANRRPSHSPIFGTNISNYLNRWEPRPVLKPRQDRKPRPMPMPNFKTNTNVKFCNNTSFKTKTNANAKF